MTIQKLQCYKCEKYTMVWLLSITDYNRVFLCKACLRTILFHTLEAIDGLESLED